jgi:two-component system invasion response regulator UvrY
MNQNMIIKVCLVDDHILLRNALAALIDNSDSCQVILQASNGKELCEQICDSCMPDVVLLDMNMPVMDGYNTATWLRDNYPAVKILMLTMYDSEIALIRLLQVGVMGFMKKDVHPHEMINAIQLVVSQGFYYSANTSSKLASLFRDVPDKSSLIQKVMLDHTEINFLKLVCTELTYKEIAIEMGLNPRSIDSIRDSLFTRLDVKSRVGLAMYAIRHGLVNL